MIQTKVADDKLSILECSERELIITLVSYAVGCMMGRYSIIRKGLNYTYETISDTNEENILLMLMELYLLRTKNIFRMILSNYLLNLLKVHLERNTWRII